MQKIHTIKCCYWYSPNKAKTCSN